jgi:hypothetical protein
LVPRCGWCKTIEGELIEVGFVESGSGPGWCYYACELCVDEQRIVPLDEHPPDSLGTVRYRPRDNVRPSPP